MFRKPIFILVLVLTFYTLLNMFRPSGLIAYAFPSACWVVLALVTFKVSGFEKIRSWTNRRITLMALLVAAFQIFILIDAGLINSFGKSPLSFTPRGIALNLTLVTTTLIGTELSRAYITKNLNRKKPTLTLVAVTLLYTLINVSIFALVNFQDPLAYSKFLGTSFLPVLTENLLATYLALISGPLASLAYRAPLQAFQWFTPILPDLPWGYQSLIGVMTPTIGFIAINMATTQRDLRKAGIPIKTRPTLRPRESQKSMKGWLAISVFLVLTVWTSTGLLGFYPTIIASGSMTPTMEVGDIAIVTSTDPSKIQAGDIIQYWKEGEMILHRVHETYQTELGKLFITKGDANNAPDPDPIFPNQIRGKLILTIPKLGWVSIAIKTAIAETVSFFTNNIMAAYATLAALAIALTGTFHLHYNSPTNKLRRRMHR